MVADQEVGVPGFGFVTHKGNIMNYTNVQDPKWANQQQTAIDCDVDFDELGLVPFTANPNDIYEYSRQIFSDCAAGRYGPVASYEPPPPPPPPSAQANKAEAERRLAATDWVNQPDVIDISRNPHLLNQASFLDYRSVIRVIAVNPTEGNLNWPTEPTAQWS